MTDRFNDHDDLLKLTSEIVGAHVANNPVPLGDLPGLIQTVFSTLTGLSKPAPEPEPELKPAVNPKKSVTDEYIVCLEDGKKLKMLKRHLATAYDMTPEQYRAKWGLPYDYPMVAPAYAKKRQELAKKIGLGRKPRIAEAEPAPKPKGQSQRAGGRAQRQQPESRPLVGCLPIRSERVGRRGVGAYGQSGSKSARWTRIELRKQRFWSGKSRADAV